MFLGPGAAIDPENIRCLNVTTLDDFKACEQADNEELRRIAMSVAAHAPYGLGIKFADIKSDVRTVTKAESEKEGDYSRITDRVRLTLVIPNDGNTGKTIAYLANHFTPIGNSRVLHIEDAFLRPNQDNGMRRMKILYRMDSGSVGEIMILHEGMAECDATTRPAYGKLRQVQKFLADQGGRADAVASTKQLTKLYGKCASLRQSAPKEFAEKCQISQFEVADEERRFFLIDDPATGEVVPVMMMPDPYRDRKMITVRPNYETGVYDIDNHFMDLFAADNFDETVISEWTNNDKSGISPRDNFINTVQSEYIAYQKAKNPQRRAEDAANDDDDDIVQGTGEHQITFAGMQPG